MNKIPITLVTGFLESGKTTAIMNIIKNRLTDLSGATLIIDMEEDGEASYEDDVLRENNIVLVKAENPGLVKAEFFQELQDAYEPNRIFVEYNGLFKVKQFESVQFPKGWEIERQMTVVDAGCFELYRKNLEGMFLDMVEHSDLVLFNRYEEGMPIKEWEALVRKRNKLALVSKIR